MSFASLMPAIHELCASMDALAALGAELRRRRDGLPVPPAVGELLQGVVERIGADLLTGLTADQEATALGIIDSFVRQAADLVERPARSPGWSYEDPVVISGQGMTSRAFVRTFEGAATRMPDFRRMLAQPGTFLDIGAGAAWLAIEVARVWPSWKVVAIDRWEPALNLARQNIAASGMQDRIELRCQDVQELADEAAFSLAWLPGPFLSAETVSHALPRVRKALVPGGWLAFSLFAPEQTRWGESLAALKVVRNGGHPWNREELETRLARLGFEQVTSFSTAGSTVTVGRRASA
jgi:SAM-dependent methyltransferase